MHMMYVKGKLIKCLCFAVDASRLELLVAYLHRPFVTHACVNVGGIG